MHIQTRKFIIDVCGYVASLTIIFFFFTLWLLSYNNTDAALKEALSISVNFLSASATIGAAIIAAKLISNWKHQSQYNEIIKCLSLLPELINDLVKSIQELRNSENTYLFLDSFFDDEAQRVDNFITPSFELVDSKMSNIRDITFQIETLSGYKRELFSEINGFNSLLQLDSHIKMLQLKIVSLPTYFNNYTRSRELNISRVNFAFDCSSKIMSKHGYKFDNLLRSEMSKLHSLSVQVRDDIREYRIWLENEAH